MRKRLAICLFIFSLAALWVPMRAAAPQSAGGAAAIRKPRLIIMLVIDQFRYDYLVRFRPYFVKGGFNLLLGGANFVDAKYDDAVTATCPGHAALSTSTATSRRFAATARRWRCCTARRCTRRPMTRCGSAG